MPDFWLTVAAVAHAQGNVDEERQANTEAKRLALLALVPRPDDPNLLGQLSVAEAGARSRTKTHSVMRVTQPRYFRRAWMQFSVPAVKCVSRKCWL